MRNLVSYAIEWRSAAEKVWIPTIACEEHVRMIQQRVPIRHKPETYPVGDCAICIAVKRNKQRLLLEGQIKKSPIRDGAPLSVRMKAV